MKKIGNFRSRAVLAALFALTFGRVPARAEDAGLVEAGAMASCAAREVDLADFEAGAPGAALEASSDEAGAEARDPEFLRARARARMARLARVLEFYRHPAQYSAPRMRELMKRAAPAELAPYLKTRREALFAFYGSLAALDLSGLSDKACPAGAAAVRQVLAQSPDGLFLDAKIGRPTAWLEFLRAGTRVIQAADADGTEAAAPERAACSGVQGYARLAAANRGAVEASDADVEAAYEESGDDGIEAAAAVKPFELFRTAAPSVVFVRGGSPSGARTAASGSVVSADGNGLILTRARAVVDPSTGKPFEFIRVHFMPDSLTGELKTDLGKGVPAKVVAADMGLDLALLSLQQKPAKLSVLPLGDDADVKAGDFVYAIGHPEQGGWWALTRGKISGRLDDAGGVPGRDVFRTNAGMNRGNFGGPLLTADGRQVGVVLPLAARGPGGRAFLSPDFALRSSAVKRWLERARTVEAGTVEETSASEEIAQEARDGTAEAAAMEESRALEAEAEVAGPDAEPAILTVAQPYSLDSLSNVPEDAADEEISESAASVEESAAPAAATEAAPEAVASNEEVAAPEAPAAPPPPPSVEERVRSSAAKAHDDLEAEAAAMEGRGATPASEIESGADATSEAASPNDVEEAAGMAPPMRTAPPPPRPAPPAPRPAPRPAPPAPRPAPRPTPPAPRPVPRPAPPAPKSAPAPRGCFSAPPHRPAPVTKVAPKPAVAPRAPVARPKLRPIKPIPFVPRSTPARVPSSPALPTRAPSTPYSVPARSRATPVPSPRPSPKPAPPSSSRMQGSVILQRGPAYAPSTPAPKAFGAGGAPGTGPGAIPKLGGQMGRLTPFNWPKTSLGPNSDVARLPALKLPPAPPTPPSKCVGHCGPAPRPAGPPSVSPSIMPIPVLPGAVVPGPSIGRTPGVAQGQKPPPNCLEQLVKLNKLQRDAQQQREAAFGLLKMTLDKYGIDYDKFQSVFPRLMSKAGVDCALEAKACALRANAADWAAAQGTYAQVQVNDRLAEQRSSMIGKLKEECEAPGKDKKAQKTAPKESVEPLEEGMTLSKLTDAEKAAIIKGAQQQQGGTEYPGVDRFRVVILKKGTIIYGGAPGEGGFYTTIGTLKKFGNDAKEIFGALQVMPRGNKMRPGLTEYIVKEDTPVAFGLIRKNPQWGPGGAAQIYMKEFATALEPVKTILLKNREVSP